MRAFKHRFDYVSMSLALSITTESTRKHKSIIESIFLDWSCWIIHSCDLDLCQAYKVKFSIQPLMPAWPGSNISASKYCVSKQQMLVSQLKLIRVTPAWHWDVFMFDLSSRKYSAGIVLAPGGCDMQDLTSYVQWPADNNIQQYTRCRHNWKISQLKYFLWFKYFSEFKYFSGAVMGSCTWGSSWLEEDNTSWVSSADHSTASRRWWTTTPSTDCPSRERSMWVWGCLCVNNCCNCIIINLVIITTSASSRCLSSTALLFQPSASVLHVEQGVSQLMTAQHCDEDPKKDELQQFCGSNLYLKHACDTCDKLASRIEFLRWHHWTLWSLENIFL